MSLTDANDVTLQSLRIDTIASPGSHGIFSSGGSDFTFSGLTVQNVTGGPSAIQPIACLASPTSIRSSAWRGTNLGGVNRVDNDSLFTGFGANAEAAINLRNCTANMISLTIDNSSFPGQDPANGKTVVFIEASGTVNMGSVTVQGSEFSGLRGLALQGASSDNASLASVFQDSTVRNAVTGGLGGINGVAATVSGSSSHSVTISNNQLDDVQLAAGNAESLSFGIFNTPGSAAGTLSNSQFIDLDGDGDLVPDARGMGTVSEQVRAIPLCCMPP